MPTEAILLREYEKWCEENNEPYTDEEIEELYNLMMEDK